MGNNLNLQELKAMKTDGPGMCLQRKQVSLSFPHLEIYLSLSKRPGKSGFGKGVAELVLRGVTAVFLFLNPDPGNAAAPTPGPPLLPVCPESPLPRIIFSCSPCWLIIFSISPRSKIISLIPVYTSLGDIGSRDSCGERMFSFLFFYKPSHCGS